jgi:hypothetical protein
MAFRKAKPALPDAWPFEDPPKTVCLTTKHIVYEDYPVLYVSRSDDDGTWQFHYGGTVTMSDALLVGIGTVVEHDPSIIEIADLPLGWCATRTKPGKPWICERLKDNQRPDLA